MPFIKKNNKTITNNMKNQKTNNNQKTKTKTNNMKNQKTNNKLNKGQNDIIKDILSSKVNNDNHMIVEKIKQLVKQIQKLLKTFKRN